MRRVAVIGAGLTGLSAAYEANRVAPDAEVVVFEASDRPGGRVRTTAFAGHLVDEGADAFLVRVPDAVELCEELGLGDELVAPAQRTAFIRVDGKLRRLPSEQLLGVPTDLDALAASGIVTAAGVEVARRDLEAAHEPLRGDAPIGEVIRERLGDEVHERLVAPLIGGINAGDADHLSIRACAPQLAAAAEQGGSLVAAAARMRARSSADPSRPVFNAPRGGMGVVIDRLTKAVEAEIRTSTPVRSLQRDGTRWTLDADPEPFDRVIVTTPAPVAASLLGRSEATGLLAAIPLVSVVMTTLAVRRERIDHPLDGSGFLVVGPAEGIITACSFSSSKWDHLSNPDNVVLRVSAGRDGDQQALSMSDAELTRTIEAELADMIGMHGQASEVRVTRWVDAFPQYRPGHVELVAEIEATVSSDLPGVAVAGAAMHGLGVPACIGQGRMTARALLG
ncbi:MAG: protoporphyrinogen oxidase [Acidimicrobiales bacterium]|nr:protoporphyrinogen oxidase [Acidimicrobiales bacterium]